MVGRIALVFLLLTLAACSTTSPPPAEEPVYEGANSLLLQAEAQAAGGQEQQAIATLERAVRLRPRNAEAWLRLAELYLQQGQYAKAEQFAGRARQLAPADVQIQRRCDALVEHVRNR